MSSFLNRIKEQKRDWKRKLQHEHLLLEQHHKQLEEARALKANSKHLEEIEQRRQKIQESISKMREDRENAMRAMKEEA